VVGGIGTVRNCRSGPCDAASARLLTPAHGPKPIGAIVGGWIAIRPFQARRGRVKVIDSLAARSLWRWAAVQQDSVVKARTVLLAVTSMVLVTWTDMETIGWRTQKWKKTIEDERYRGIAPETISEIVSKIEEPSLVMPVLLAIVSTAFVCTLIFIAIWESTP
jgi:hypothetical protein